MNRNGSTSVTAPATDPELDGKAPSRPLHEWRERLHQKQWERATWRTKLWWFRQAVGRAPETFREALRTLRQHGDRVKEAYGVSRLRQLVRQCYISLRHDTSPASYYTYRLYRPERWQRAHTLLYDSWTSHGYMIHVLNTLTDFPSEDKEALDDKCCFFARCERHNLPTPPVLASFEAGTARFLCSSARTLPEEHLFVKPRGGKQGRGATKYVYVGEERWTNEGTTYDPSALINRLKQRSEQEPLVLQRALRNASSWRPFTSGGLTTVRLMTGRRPEGDILPLGAALRMPTGSAIVDNVNAGGIAAQIDLPSGQLSPAISIRPVNGTLTHNVHPDTEHPLSGTTLPGWADVLALGRRAHDAFDVVTIAWDIALTPDGFTIMEGNCSWSASPLQIPQIQLRRYATVYDAWMKDRISDL